MNPDELEAKELGIAEAVSLPLHQLDLARSPSHQSIARTVSAGEPERASSCPLRHSWPILAEEERPYRCRYSISRSLQSTSNHSSGTVSDTISIRSGVL